MKPILYYFDLLSEQLAAHYGLDCVSEQPQPMAPIDEQLIQCIWAEQLLAGTLETQTDLSVEVINPGDWNHGPGPDFLDAEIMLDGITRKGDIEIHLRSNDFQNHKHDRDYEYNRLVLHVFLAQTDEEPRDLLHNGNYVERLELEQYLFPDLDTIRRTISVSDIQFSEGGPVGKCQPVFAMWDADTTRDFLDSAGCERFESKARRMADQLPGEGIEQAFYQSLMSLMGQRGGRALYFLLAKRTPLIELREYLRDVDPNYHVMMLEAIYLHIAQLLPDEKKLEKMSDEEHRYLDSLRELWSQVEPYLNDRIIKKTPRWLSGIRPANFPYRRLSGIARWLAPRLQEQDFLARNYKAFKAALPQVWNKRNSLQLSKHWMAHYIIEDENAFWSTRFSWGGKQTASPQNLIGESHARAILLNILLPTLLLIARDRNDAEFEQQLFRFWKVYPKLPENRIVKRMKHRLFADNITALSLLNTEQRQQALYQVYHEFCRDNSMACDQCAFFKPDNVPNLGGVDE